MPRSACFVTCTSGTVHNNGMERRSVGAIPGRYPPAAAPGVCGPGSIECMGIADDWDAEAERFDEELDHGLLQASVRAAWGELMLKEVPPGSAVLDLGCGTGSLSVLLAEQGHEVTGVDLSPRMLEQAVAKADNHGVNIRFLLGDAADPPVEPGFDVVLARHLVWALPDPSKALDRWLGLMPADGRLVLIEGLWGTGAGISADTLSSIVTPKTTTMSVRLLADPALWGRTLTDERYVLTGKK